MSIYFSLNTYVHIYSRNCKLPPTYIPGPAHRFSKPSTMYTLKHFIPTLWPAALGISRQKMGGFFVEGNVPRMHLYTFFSFFRIIGTFAQMFFRALFRGNQPAQHFMGDSTAFLECPDPGFELKCSNILNSQIPASNVLDYFKSLSHQTGASVLLVVGGLVVVVVFFMRSPHKMFSYTRHMVILGVSNKSGTPKWMVCNGKPY